MEFNKNLIIINCKVLRGFTIASDMGIQKRLNILGRFSLILKFTSIT